MSGSDRLRGRVIGVYGSGGAPWHHLALAAMHGASVRVVRAEDVAAGRLADLDVLIMPGGGAMAMAGLLAPLGADGAARVRAWVEGGGTYVSSCAGSVLPLALTGAADAANPTARHMRMGEVSLANTGDATLGGLSSPGVGRIRVRLAPSHPYAAGLPETIDVVHYNGPLFAVATHDQDAATVEPHTAEGVGTTDREPNAFAWPVAATSDFTPAERFLAPGEAPAPPDPGADDTTLQRCIASGAATGIEARHGAGRLVLFGSHPEFGLGPLLLGWGHGSELLVAALADSAEAPANASPAPPGELDRHAGAGRHTGDPRRLASAAATSLRVIAERFERLAASEPGSDPDGWLAPGTAAAFHGTPAHQAWGRDAKAAATVATAAADQLTMVSPHLDPADLPWLDDEPRCDQDFGFMGLTQLLDRVNGMLTGAEVALTQPPVRPGHAYDLFDSHPFHLAVGSYLSAAGLVSGAFLTCALLAHRHGTLTSEATALLWPTS